MEWKHASLEQCKKLQELGVVLETEKVWVYSPIFSEPSSCRLMTTTESTELRKGTSNKSYPAPDVAELGKVLGKYIVIQWPWETEVLNVFDRKFKHRLSVHDDISEAQARCAAYIWLIENGYLKVEEVKI